VLVIDDASTDGSRDLIRSGYPCVRVIENKKRRGPAFCKNLGIQNASNDLLLFLDSDVVLTASTIPELLEKEAGSTAVCFQPKILFFGKTDVLNSTGGVANQLGYAWDRGIFEKDTGQYDGAIVILFATSAAMLIRKDAFSEVGLFDPDYFYLNEDFDLGYRLAMQGFQTHYVPSAVCYHHMSHTMGRVNPRVKYLMERNRIATVIKDYEWKTLRRFFPEMLRIRTKKYREHYRTVEGNKNAYIWAAFASWFWIIIMFGNIMCKRFRIQRKRTVTDEDIFSLFKEYKELRPVFLQ
jgi:GT2 family glycosyltransferase